MIKKLTGAAGLVVSMAEVAQHLKLILPSATTAAALSTTAIDTNGYIVSIVPNTSAAIQHSNDGTTWATWITVTAMCFYTGGYRYIKTASAGCMYFKQSVVSDQSADLTLKIAAATTMAETFLGRKLGSQTWQITLDDWPELPYILPIPDLISLDDFYYYDYENTKSDDISSYFLTSDDYYPRLDLKDGCYLPYTALQEIAGVEINITCGIVAPTELMKLGILEYLKIIYNGGNDFSLADRILSCEEKL